jgi:hypothetical protein
MRLIPVIDYLNNRYMDLNVQSNEADQLFDFLNQLYKFHSNPISFVYNSLIYYTRAQANNPQLELVNKLKKKRLFSILAGKLSCLSLAYL